MTWLLTLITSVISTLTHLFAPSTTPIPNPTPTIAPIPALIVTSPTKTPATTIKISPTKPTAATQPTSAPSSNSNPQPTATSISYPTSTPIRIPTSTPTKTPTPTPHLSGSFSVSTNNVNVTLSRAANIGGLVYGAGFTLTNGTAGSTGFCIIGDGSGGQGFYTGSGGIGPGQSYNIQTYINTNKPNGTYSGSSPVKYGDNCSTTNGTLIDTVSYTITLTD